MVLQARRAVSGGIHHVTRNLSSRHQVAPVLWLETELRIKSSSKYQTTQSGKYLKSNSGTCLEEHAEYFEPSPIPTHHLGHEVALLRGGPNLLFLHNASRLFVISQSQEFRMAKPISFGPFQEFDIALDEHYFEG